MMLALVVCSSFPLAAQDVRVLLAKGDSLLELGKPQRSMDYYDQAVALGENAAAYAGRAKAWYTMERMDKFVLDVEKALKLDSTLAEAHYQRGLYAMRANDPEKAEYHAGKAAAHSTNGKLTAQAYLLRGEARADLGRAAPAIDDLERGLKGGMDDLEAMRTLARLYDSAGRHADALAVLERLCDIQPTDVGNWSNRAYELIMLDRTEEALPVIERALLIDKDEPVALANRAYIHLKMGKEQEAWSDVERSLRSYPANPHALRTRAMLRLRKGEREKACEDLTLSRALGGAPEVDLLIKEHCASAPNQKKR
ncbi:MAG: tetratricopeptide repeat protein [Flavobacteriales bacterium]|nr:tetratricopeptide repeat protein [Flavobacteriales bacterium]